MLLTKLLLLALLEVEKSRGAPTKLTGNGRELKLPTFGRRGGERCDARRARALVEAGTRCIQELRVLDATQPGRLHLCGYLEQSACLGPGSCSSPSD